jgi:general secretion pathway protein G
MAAPCAEQSGLLRDPHGKNELAVAPSAQAGLLRHPSGREPLTSAPSAQSGFTLIEIMIVLTIVGILMTIAEPSYRNQIIKAREAALKKDLFVVRDVLDQFAADQGRYPDGLQDLVDQKYLRGLPTDPFTHAADTWIEVREEVSDSQETAGVFDLHSGSNLVASDGTAYNTW